MVFIASMTLFAVMKVKKEEHIKTSAGHPVLNSNEIEFTGTNLRKLMGGAFAGGVVNAIGLGGGVIFNPLLFNLGMCP